VGGPARRIVWSGAAGRVRKECAMAVEDLRKSTMMSHLLDALEQGEDIGHYGRLVFVMVARYFVDEDELVKLLLQGGDTDEAKARALVQQVSERDYSPPRRERILEWQAKQEFPICPDSDDPDACNIYRELEFPDSLFEHIEEYREQKV
jgi:DNA primase large subunit